jgi:hypothetical protein
MKLFKTVCPNEPIAHHKRTMPPKNSKIANGKPNTNSNATDLAPGAKLEAFLVPVPELMSEICHKKRQLGQTHTSGLEVHPKL